LNIFDGAPKGDATFVPVDEPRTMSIADIENAIVKFLQGAKKAMD